MKGLDKIDWMEKEEWDNFLDFLRKKKDNKLIQKKVKALKIGFYVRQDMITLTKNQRDLADIKRHGMKDDIFVCCFPSEKTLKSKDEIKGVASRFFQSLRHLFGVVQCHGEEKLEAK